MVALVILVLLLAILGGLGFAVHVLWYVLIAAVILWLIGFFIGGASPTGGRRGYGRWCPSFPAADSRVCGPRGFSWPWVRRRAARALPARRSPSRGAWRD